MRRLALLFATSLAAAAWVGAPAHASTVWLCSPAKTPNPCTESLDFTAVAADGTAKVYRVGTKRQQPIDCFYVYPTVSTEHTGNSDLKPGIEETDTAHLQASWFSPVCRVFAPMYRQVTAFGNSDPSLHADRDLAYSDVRNAWRDYLAHWNHGRGVVLIGHSQGAFHLKRLIQEELDDKPAQRRLLVSAVLLGGDVVVGNTPGVKGDFEHVPPCASKSQTGCVVAFSSWDRRPPANASFEEVANRSSQHVLCVNPAAPGGGSAPITPLFPAGDHDLIGGVLLFAAQTDWISFPNLYRARCVRQGHRSWLQVDVAASGNKRPTVKELNGPAWGLHQADVNIALFDLFGLVASQATAYAAHH